MAAPGKVIRKLLPRGLERRAANAYRSYYIDLSELARTIHSLGPFDHVIEVGCGEGALATQIARVSNSTFTGIDIADGPGANFVGDRTRATFRQASAEELVTEGARADAVVVSDVLHHVESDKRVEFLHTCEQLVAPGGMLIVKEWERRRNVAYALAYGSDRYLTGDTHVAFASRSELIDLFTGALAGMGLVCECRIPPRRNNLLFAFRPTSST